MLPVCGQWQRAGLGERAGDGQEGQVGVQRDSLNRWTRSGDSAPSFLSRPFSRSTAPRSR
jgi:hypothetical protein